MIVSCIGNLTRRDLRAKARSAWSNVMSIKTFPRIESHDGGEQCRKYIEAQQNNLEDDLSCLVDGVV